MRVSARVAGRGRPKRAGCKTKSRCAGTSTFLDAFEYELAWRFRWDSATEAMDLRQATRTAKAPHARCMSPATSRQRRNPRKSGGRPDYRALGTPPWHGMCAAAGHAAGHQLHTDARHGAEVTMRVRFWGVELHHPDRQPHQPEAQHWVKSWNALPHLDQRPHTIVGWVYYGHKTIVEKKDGALTEAHATIERCRCARASAPRHHRGLSWSIGRPRSPGSS